MIRFARWLRANYEFPIRVPVYLSPHAYLMTRHGEVAFATFFGPFGRDTEPYIRIATGDYAVHNKKKEGRNNALASYLVALAHEVIHYQQWVKTGDFQPIEQPERIKGRKLFVTTRGDFSGSGVLRLSCAST